MITYNVTRWSTFTHLGFVLAYQSSNLFRSFVVFVLIGFREILWETSSDRDTSSLSSFERVIEEFYLFELDN